MPWPVPGRWLSVLCPVKEASFSRLLLADELPRFGDSRGPTAISPNALISALVILIMQNDARQ